MISEDDNHNITINMNDGDIRIHFRKLFLKGLASVV
jgi:hypothetical protein